MDEVRTSTRSVGQSVPLIVTAELPAQLAAWASGLRREHYPPQRNFLQAHVTLFHGLPPSVFDELRTRLAQFSATYAPPPARLSGLISLDTGTAIAVESRALLNLREQLASHFHGVLTAQDRGRPKLHITIQNKVSAKAARTLQHELAPMIRPQDFAFAGLSLHHYLGGPWEPAGTWRFRGKEGG